MLKTVRALFIAAIGMVITPVASAQLVDTGRLFFGTGVSSNEMSGTDSALGWQIFGGYGFGEVAKNFHFDAEVGYMDSGSMDRPGQTSEKANGLWAAGVGRFLLTSNIELLARLGMDFGDDDGLLAGVGAGLLLTKNIKLRFEFVKRDHVDSWQFNLVFYP